MGNNPGDSLRPSSFQFIACGALVLLNKLFTNKIKINQITKKRSGLQPWGSCTLCLFGNPALLITTQLFDTVSESLHHGVCDLYTLHEHTVVFLWLLFDFLLICFCGTDDNPEHLLLFVCLDVISSSGYGMLNICAEQWPGFLILLCDVLSLWMCCYCLY